MATQVARRPFTGSCHCGNVKYVVYLKVPHQLPDPPKMPTQWAYRCSCTSCHKTGVLHLRLQSAPDDFALLSPLDPLAELSDYQCFEKNLHWLFCKTCGVRCFTFMGQHEVVEAELPGYGPEGETVKFWRPAKGLFEEGGSRKDSGFSVNAITIDAGQDGADLVDWANRKAISYINGSSHLNSKPEDAIADTPFLGGCY
ncbi:hypothetical protein GQ53DRAFT_741139 [Thozetella sp. PMI_491]|nr:hypothetical protein GQ53DRAFT_741139 [Thozetella sp. PMI_491]